MADIVLADLTNATTADDGTGVFDVLMNAAELHINNQYDSGRITGVEYATVYLGALQSVLQESVKYILGEQGADKQADEIAAGTTRSDLESTAKIALLTAQTLGFKTDTKQKVMKQLIEGHNVHLSLVGGGNHPEAFQDAAIDMLAQDILEDVDPGTAINIQQQTDIVARGEDSAGYLDVGDTKGNGYAAFYREVELVSLIATDTETELLDITSGNTYLWSGTAYVQVTP